MADTSDKDSELSLSGLTRRERLERIAKAERDRRGGREALAIAAIGEPNEWPARVVLALARLSNDDEQGARQLLEEGLDVWAREAGLPPLAASEVEPGRASSLASASLVDAEARVEESPPRRSEPEPTAAASWAPLEIPEPPPLDERLDGPFDSFELDRAFEQAFEQAEVQIDEMHDVNRVAARVLMDEPVGLAELSGHPIESLQPDSGAEDRRDSEPAGEPEVVPAGAELDPSVAPAWSEVPSSEALRVQMDAAFVEGELAEDDALSPAIEGETGAIKGDTGRSRAVVLATLERWLHNLERRRTREAR